MGGLNLKLNKVNNEHSTFVLMVISATFHKHKPNREGGGGQSQIDHWAIQASFLLAYILFQLAPHNWLCITLTGLSLSKQCMTLVGSFPPHANVQISKSS